MKIDFSGLESGGSSCGANNELFVDGITSAPAFQLPNSIDKNQRGIGTHIHLVGCCEGGFGRVYKGRLESTNQIVAIKQLDRNGVPLNKEFLVEVLMLSLLHHNNLVNLIGYCADGDQRCGELKGGYFILAIHLCLFVRMYFVCVEN